MTDNVREIEMLCVHCGAKGVVRTEIIMSSNIYYVDHVYTCSECGFRDHVTFGVPNDTSK